MKAVSAPIKLFVAHIPVPSILAYDSADPYAVRLTMTPLGQQSITWDLSRDMLSVGLLKCCGEMDVQVHSCGKSDEMDIHIRSHEGKAHLVAVYDDVLSFLVETYVIVPAGQEFIDMDAEIEALLGGRSG